MRGAIVDTHVHVISPDLERFPLQPPGVNTGPWWETHPCSADLLRLLMADAGVDRAVLVQGVGAYGFDNEYTLAASKAAPEVFANVVCTDRRADDATATLARPARAGRSRLPVVHGARRRAARPSRARCGTRWPRCGCRW